MPIRRAKPYEPTRFKGLSDATNVKVYPHNGSWVVRFFKGIAFEPLAKDYAKILESVVNNSDTLIAYVNKPLRVTVITMPPKRPNVNTYWRVSLSKTFKELHKALAFAECLRNAITNEVEDTIYG